MNRRDFLVAAAIPALSNLQSSPATALASKAGQFGGQVCLFSKHVAWLAGRELAATTKQIGFDGIDLTVRPGGHVLPQKAASDLPPLVETIRAEGLQVPMITTALLSPSEPVAQPILQTAGELGIRFAKLGYYKYEFRDLKADLDAAAAQLKGLADLAGRCKIELGYHNHSGYLGAPVWDIAKIIEPLDPRRIGYYFDIRHSVVEGGNAGWRIATLLVAPRLKMVAVKDFYWEKGPKGWAIRDCPLGEGMVNWPQFLKMLASAGFHGPISVHVEYDPGGTSEPAKHEAMLRAAERDLQFLRTQLKTAYASVSGT